MYKNNIRTRKKKELFLDTSRQANNKFFICSNGNILNTHVYKLQKNHRSDFSCLPFVSFPYIFINIFNLFSYYGCFRIYVCYGRKIDYYEKAASLWMPLLMY